MKQKKIKLPDTIENIADKTYNDVGFVLKSDEAINALLTINKRGFIAKSDLKINDSVIDRLINNNYIKLRNNNYILSVKSKKILTLLQIEINEDSVLKNFINIDYPTVEKPLSKKDLKNFSQSKLKAILNHNNIKNNEFIYLNIENREIKCNILLNYFSDINKLLNNIHSIIPKGMHFTCYFQNLSQRKKEYNLFSKFFKKSLLCNRAFSKAELLGRIIFTGFKIIDYHEYKDFTYTKSVSTDKKNVSEYPHYGLFTKLLRIGQNRRPINVYKFRTMYPYSEFLHQYIYENCHLENGGNIKIDYRVTPLGKILRKLCLDELPIIINFFKGEIKLVGVRALSNRYFDLYPEDVKKMRIKFKPGLLPPFFADLPNSFEGIVDSEKKYLLSYQKSPIITDVKYFLKSYYNIIFRSK